MSAPSPSDRWRRDGASSSWVPPTPHCSRDAANVTMSYMTWFIVGRTEAEWRERARRVHSQDPDAGPFDAYLEDVSRDCVIGKIDQAVETLGAYRDAGA